MATTKGNSVTWTSDIGKGVTINVVVSEYYDTSTGKFYVGVDTVQMLSQQDWYIGYNYYLDGTITVGGSRTILSASGNAGTFGTGWMGSYDTYYPFGALNGSAAGSYNTGWLASCSNGSSTSISVNLTVLRPTGYTDGAHGVSLSGSKTLTFKHSTGHTNTATGNKRTDATCTAAATYWYKCAGCGTQSSSYFSSGSALGHKSVNGGTVDVHTKCERCGITLSSAHSFTTKTTTAATCTTDGINTHSCDCGYSYTSSIAATGHTEVNGGTANVHTKCSTCGITIKDGSSHSYTSNIQTPATCTEKGTAKYDCECGYSYTSQDIAALGHDYKGTVIAPSCTEQGYTSYECSRCSDTSKANDTYTAALGHNYEGEITIAPTYTKPGEMTYTCSRCSDYYLEALARKQGAVQIQTATGYRPHLAYVRNSAGWVLCVPNVRKSNNEWNPCG